MARWRAEVFVNSKVGQIPVEVDAGSFEGARQLIQHIYSPQAIYNLSQIGETRYNGDSSSDGGGSAAGLGAMITVGFLLWLFAQYTPFVLMFLGGILGGKTTQLLIGKNIDEICDDDDWKSALSILLVGLIVGGTGFYFGDRIHKEHFAEQPKPAQIRNHDKTN